MTLSETNYKEYIGSLPAVPVLRGTLEEQYVPSPLAVCSVIVTLDGYLLFFRRASNVAENAGRLHVCGGQPTSVDLFGEITKEITEELGVESTCQAGMICTGLMQHWMSRKLELTFWTDLRLSSLECEQRMERLRHFEHVRNESGLFCVRVPAEQDQLSHYVLQQDAQLTPPGQAAVVLYGREKFGERWFSEVEELLKMRWVSELYSSF